ncbi:hypothetical protein CAC42_817 [Sphaceloma murrayae]|uniref:Uncharacterized protein n=1 Tax=Sphaceloma murrayae TaxID=2082308 RepID=A0A2K1QK74_9PEZI|nr:hypothetical protein CAC42_817 [Sphaceloma murrayae]
MSSSSGSTRRLAPGLFGLLVLCALISSVSAQEPSDECFIDQGNTRPGGSFAFSAWLRQGNCVRGPSSATYEVCRNNLQNQLENFVDGLHQQEYSASATVLALLPTIGAFVGTPSREIWPLLSIFPFAAVLVLTMSFGGDTTSTNIEDYRAVLEKKGMKAIDWSGDEQSADSLVEGGGGWAQQRDRLHTCIAASFERSTKRIKEQATRDSKITPARFTILVLIAILFLFGLLGSTMAGMAILEHGAIYVTWCTATWWFHAWYIVVTFTAVFDQWIQTPFTKRWTVFITEHSNASNCHEHFDTPDRSPRPSTLRELAASTSPTAFRTALHQCSSLAPPATTTANPHQTTQLNIALKINEDRIPTWIALLRFFSKAVGVTIYVFGTSVFAAVALLALPMSQMILVLVMGAGVFSRALAAGLVSLMREQGLAAVLLVCVDQEETADRLLLQALEYRGTAEKRVVSEVDGMAWERGECVGRRSRWWRLGLGMLTRPVAGVGELGLEGQREEKGEGRVDVEPA